jgi:hypothetical protein
MEVILVQSDFTLPPIGKGDREEERCIPEAGAFGMERWWPCHCSLPGSRHGTSGPTPFHQDIKLSSFSAPLVAVTGMVCSIVSRCTRWSAWESLPRTCRAC